jgi:predicted ATPase
MAEAERTNFPLSIGEALRVALCDIALMTGDLQAAEHAIAMLIDIATSHNAPFWGISGRCLRGKLLVIRGEFADGVALLRAELELCERTGWAIWYPEFIAALAEGLAGLGQIAEALVAVDKGLASADHGGERIWYADLLRFKGELLLERAAGRSEADAADSFSAALALARRQGALSLELRAAISFARLRVGQNRPDEARAILAPVHEHFTEGFSTPDLVAARKMLDTLPS